MPTLFFIRCSHCAFALKTDDSRTYLRMETGGRELLPHPREYDRARELSGKELSTLDAEGRLELVDVYYCRSCGALDEFPRPRPESDRATVDDLEALLGARPCAACGTRDGWRDVFSIDGERCPQCRDGELSTEWDIE